MSHNDERRPVGGGESSNGLAGQPQSKTNVRQIGAGRTTPIHVWAHGYLVVGTRGRCRMVMIVARCPFRACGRPHVHNADPSFTVGKRTASCHGGTYLVHLGTVEGEGAA